LELTCDQKIEKKVAIRASEISGLQMSQKDGTSAAGGDLRLLRAFCRMNPTAGVQMAELAVQVQNLYFRWPKRNV